MAHTWLSDWELITKDWDVVADAEKFSAIGRLFAAANQKGRQQAANGEPNPLTPAEYDVPDL